MNSLVSSFRNFFDFGNARNSHNADETSKDPELGFSIFFYKEKKCIGVQVIAARNLPQNFGNNLHVKGYFVKVKLYPGKHKFETAIVASKSPCFDEQFEFPVDVENTLQLNSFFVNFTIYAEFEGASLGSRAKKRSSMREHIEGFLSTNKDVTLRRNVSRSSSMRASARLSINNRRSLGAITFKLEEQIFTGRGKAGTRFTPDIWRTMGPIASGLNVVSRESKKGSLEVLMKYSHSENGKNDMIQISLSKFRCSMATMHEHEKLGGNLYLTMATHECAVIVAKWKGDTFAPMVSLLIEPQSATLISTINNYNLEQTKVVIKLKCCNLLQQKITLGVITIDKNTPLFQSIVQHPTMCDKNMFHFE